MLETEIKSLIAAVNANTEALKALAARSPEVAAQAAAIHVSATAAPTAQAAPLVQQQAAQATPVVQQQAAQPTTTAMPGMPTFVATPTATTALPFADTAGLMQYTMAKYQALGKDKGALIQNVLNQIGVAALNEITPDKFQAYFNGVEAIQ